MVTRIAIGLLLTASLASAQGLEPGAAPADARAVEPAPSLTDAQREAAAAAAPGRATGWPEVSGTASLTLRDAVVPEFAGAAAVLLVVIGAAGLAWACSRVCCGTGARQAAQSSRRGLRPH